LRKDPTCPSLSSRRAGCRYSGRRTLQAGRRDQN